MYVHTYLHDNPTVKCHYLESRAVKLAISDFRFTFMTSDHVQAEQSDYRTQHTDSQRAREDSR
jgi:hypothetical protein